MAADMAAPVTEEAVVRVTEARHRHTRPVVRTVLIRRTGTTHNRAVGWAGAAATVTVLLEDPHYGDEPQLAVTVHRHRHRRRLVDHHLRS